ncbi:MAG: hypothetical protein ABL883_11340 [Terricaulis sp.]
MLRLLCALALALAAPANAEDSATAGNADASAAAPISASQSIIAAAGADGVFAPGNPDGSVRHLGSGLVCHFQNDGAGGRIVLFPGLPRGDDVACEFADGRHNIRLHATRLPQRASLDELVAAVETAVRRSAPGAASYSGTLRIANGAGLPASRSMQYLLPGEDGARDYLRVTVAQVGAWTIKMRYRAPAPDDVTARRLEERSELTWRGVLAEIGR